MEEPESAWPRGDFRPVPDPTRLTAIAVEAAKDDLRREIGAAREVLQARLDAMDKAIVLLQTILDRMLPLAQAQVDHLQHLMNQRFDTHEQRFLGVTTSFAERDVRTEQSSHATKLAIDAALQAQKEAVAAQNAHIAQALGRIEATGQKQIEQLVTLLQTSIQAAEGKISDLKDRLTSIEGRSAGIGASWGVVAAFIGFTIGAIGVVTAIFKP